MSWNGMMDRLVWNVMFIFHQVTNSIRHLTLLSRPSQGDNVCYRHAGMHSKWSFITFSLKHIHLLTVDVYVLISSSLSPYLNNVGGLSVHPMTELNWCNGTETLVSNLSITNAMGVLVLPPQARRNQSRSAAPSLSSAMYCQLIGRRVAIHLDILNLIVYSSNNIWDLLFFTLEHSQSVSKGRAIERISIPKWDNWRLPTCQIC